LKHNGCARLVNISGDWAYVEFEVRNGKVAAGWLRSAYLRTAPLPPGPPPAPAATASGIKDMSQIEPECKDAMKRVSFHFAVESSEPTS